MNKLLPALTLLGIILSYSEPKSSDYSHMNKDSIILYEHVTKFIITEGEYDHRGNKRKLNFDINKYSKFADKIIYLPDTKREA